MFTKNTWIVSLVLSSAVLTACQGENTFRRESDPYPEHKALYEQALPYDPARPTPNKSVPVPVTSTPACNEPFKMTIEDSKDGGKSLEFVAGQEKSVTVKVTTNLEAERKWEVRPVISPADASFTVVEKNAQGATYKLKWKPTHAPTVQDQFLVLRYDYLMDVRCQSAPVNESIALIVNGSAKSEPFVSIANIPTTPIVFGSEAIRVVIKVMDPNGSAKKAPDIDSISYKFAGVDLKVNSKLPPLDCQDKGAAVEATDGVPTWAFECSLEVKNLVSQKQLKKLSGSGQTVDAELSIQAQSKATKLNSDVSTAKLQVLFEKIDKTASAEKVGE